MEVITVEQTHSKLIKLLVEKGQTQLAVALDHLMNLYPDLLRGAGGAPRDTYPEPSESLRP